jgi:quercetin dioxygenase-like cupin family protein
MKTRQAGPYVAGIVLAVVAIGTVLAYQQELPPGPQLVYQAEFDPAELPEDFTVKTLVLDIAPGAETPLHSHPGPGIVLIIEGELVSFGQDGQEVTYVAGESFQEGPGQVHAVRNDGEATVRLLFSILLPTGEPLTKPVD